MLTLANGVGGMRSQEKGATFEPQKLQQQQSWDHSKALVMRFVLLRLRRIMQSWFFPVFQLSSQLDMSAADASTLEMPVNFARHRAGKACRLVGRGCFHVIWMSLYSLKVIRN